MSKGARFRHLARAITDLQATAKLLPEAERQWEELAGGMRAQALDGPSPRPRPLIVKPPDDPELAGRHIVADPTGDAAVAVSKIKRDARELERLLATVERVAHQAAQIVERHAVTIPLKAAELAELKRSGDPGCEIVGRIERDDQGGRYWEPVHRVTSLNGLLARDYRLGRWAYDFARREGRLPTRAETQAHCEGRRVRPKAS